MRILQIAPLISPKNDYGGPTTVALGQCQALQAAGHDVILAAGTWGYYKPPSRIGDIRVELFPARAVVPGSALGGLTAPSLFPWLRRAAPGADIVHLHLARDLLTLPAAAWCAIESVPFVVQTHGMVVESSNPFAAPLDALMTRRVMKAAGRVFYLTESEQASLRLQFPAANLEFLRNGITVSEECAERDRNVRPEVLFMARVQERKRPLHFIAMARVLALEFPDVTFRMVGPDEGQGRAVLTAIAQAGLGDRLVWNGALSHDQAMKALNAASIYVLPSVNEPYPMAVLEALARGVPVVITESCGLAACVRDAGAGLVVSADPISLTNAVRKLLADKKFTNQAASAARSLSVEHLAMPTVTRQLSRAYEGVLKGS